LTILDIVKQVN